MRRRHTHPSVVAVCWMILVAIAPAWSVAESPAHVVSDAPVTLAHQTFVSNDATVTISSEFAGGRMSRCEQVDDDHFIVTIAPETDPINDSAWYAFRVHGKHEKTIQIDLVYASGSHRYAPKISHDGRQWKSGTHLIQNQLRHGRQIELNVPVRKDLLWIAGQELVSTDDMSNWSRSLANKPHVDRKVIGQSVQGRPIERLTITESPSPDYVFVVARQHPPEVTGAIGMMHFVDALSADQPLAKDFRQRYAAVVVPTMNPDGVVHGHWRCNANGIDLNRDWSHFSQPETRAVRDEMLQCRSDASGRLCLFVDFHSTYEDVFYTPPRRSKLFPPGFTQRWLTSLQQRYPKFDVNIDDDHNAHRSTSKAWVHRTLGVTAITYEFGDETERDTIRQIASGSAEEMMRLLLRLPPRNAVAQADPQRTSEL